MEWFFYLLVKKALDSFRVGYLDWRTWIGAEKHWLWFWIRGKFFEKDLHWSSTSNWWPQDFLISQQDQIHCYFELWYDLFVCVFAWEEMWMRGSFLLYANMWTTMFVCRDQPQKKRQTKETGMGVNLEIRGLTGVLNWLMLSYVYSLMTSFDNTRDFFIVLFSFILALMSIY